MIAERVFFASQSARISPRLSEHAQHPASLASCLALTTVSPAPGWGTVQRVAKGQMPPSSRPEVNGE